MDDNDDNNVSHFKQRMSVLDPINELTKDLPKLVIEKIAIDAIYEHRRLLKTAEELHDDMREAPEEGAADDVSAATIHYTKAMIALHAHMFALSALLHVLGYTPNVPAVTNRN